MNNEPPERPAQPAEFYRWRASEYQKMADETTDPNLANLYRDLAAAFIREAERIERGEPTTS